MVINKTHGQKLLHADFLCSFTNELHVLVFLAFFVFVEPCLLSHFFFFPKCGKLLLNRKEESRTEQILPQKSKSWTEFSITKKLLKKIDNALELTEL